jgi:sodium/bile acid cotransporter 7
MFCGFQFAPQFRAIEQWHWVMQAIIASVMFAMALPIELQSIQRILRSPIAPILASLVNLGLAPLLAWPMARLLGPELGPGLIVAAATPCTLASASVWTRKAGGNDAVSMMVTLMTNGVCFIVTPMWVRVLTAGQVAPFAVLPIMLQLLLIVLCPIVLAQLLHRREAIARWSVRYKTPLGVYAQLGVLTMIMFGISQMANRLEATPTSDNSLGRLVACGVIALLLHLCLFWVSWRVAGWWKVPREDQIAVGFSASQKTLMVGLSTTIQLGMSAIPLIMYHLLQLLVDTALADRLRSKLPAEDESTNDSVVD